MMKLKCACGCGNIIDYEPGQDIYYPGHNPNPVPKIQTERISIKTALGRKSFKIKKTYIKSTTPVLTRSTKKYIRDLAGHRCFLCGRIEIKNKNGFSVCTLHNKSMNNDIAVLLCGKCKSNKNKYSTPIINKFNALGNKYKYNINGFMAYKP